MFHIGRDQQHAARSDRHPLPVAQDPSVAGMDELLVLPGMLVGRNEAPGATSIIRMQ